MVPIKKHCRKVLAVAVGLLLLGLTSLGYAQCATPDVLGDMVKVDSGPIVGETKGALHSYKGIPYAAPPVGELRWKAPQPVAAWTTNREAKAFGPRSIQGGGGGGNRGAANAPAENGAAQNGAAQNATAQQPARTPAATPTSEDCLYLNIVSPAKSPADKLPVLVNIHGGNFTGGSGQMDMSKLAETENIVCVGINYRLGALGLMAHPALSKESPQGVSGNYGLLDQIAALKWVQKNIAAFGGNPDLVTITGCSAGGESILYMMASPLSKGLFVRAIPCAGPYAGRTPTLEAAEKNGQELMARLGVTESADTLKAMRAVPAQQLLSGTRMFPTIDKWVLSDTSLNVFKAGKQANVPMMIGSGAADIAGPQNQSGDRGFAAAMSTVPSKAYLYIFTQGAASHCMDQQYILGSVFGRPNASEADKACSKNMMTIWGQFIRTGDPSVKGLVEWPAFTDANDQYLDISDKLEVKKGVLAASRPRSGGGARRGTSDQLDDEEDCNECEELVSFGPESTSEK